MKGKPTVARWLPGSTLVTNGASSRRSKLVQILPSLSLQQPQYQDPFRINHSSTELRRFNFTYSKNFQRKKIITHIF